MSYFAREITDQWATWDSPAQRRALDWVDAEFGNLRAGFRWAVDRDDVAAATTIAAHTALLGLVLQRFEAVAWAEELLPAATTADVPMLPRLYTAASLCTFTGRPHDAVGHREALRLGLGGGHEPFAAGLSRFFEAGHSDCGDVEQSLQTGRVMAEGDGLERCLGQAVVLYNLPNVGGGEEARALADETLSAAALRQP
jgi:hypothetical protein